METRGLRNNNPGNIEHGEKWQGLAEEQLDERFCTFSSPEYGIRAIVKIIQSYNKKYKINTVKGIISRWAPPNENDTEAYIKNVCKAAGKAPESYLNTSDPVTLMGLVKGITKQENGSQPYSDETIMAGIKLALA